MVQGPRECSDRDHPHVLMCPVQATSIAATVVMAGMARREDGIGQVWWELGLKGIRYGDAEAAVRDLVSGGLGERSWITARDVIRRAKAIRHERHARAPEPDPPAGLDWEKHQAFIRWYWTAVGNGETPTRSLELAATTIGADRYLPPAPPDTGEPVEAGGIDLVRSVLEQAKKDRARRLT